MTQAPATDDQPACDDCGQPDPVVIDVGDGSRLCARCVAAYDARFSAIWFRPLHPIHPTDRRRQP